MSENNPELAKIPEMDGVEIPDEILQELRAEFDLLPMVTSLGGTVWFIRPQGTGNTVVPHSTARALAISVLRRLLQDASPDHIVISPTVCQEELKEPVWLVASCWDLNDDSTETLGKGETEFKALLDAWKKLKEG